MNKSYKMALELAGDRIKQTLDQAKETIIDLIKENGGVIKTPAESGKPTLYAYYYDDDFEQGTHQVPIHGLRYDEENGLTLCTDEMLDNYQFDTGYQFEYYYDFEGEDLKNLEKALADPAYFVEWDKYDLISTDTLLSLIYGLPAYM